MKHQDRVPPIKGKTSINSQITASLTNRIGFYNRSLILDFSSSFLLSYYRPIRLFSVARFLLHLARADDCRLDHKLNYPSTPLVLSRAYTFQEVSTLNHLGSLPKPASNQLKSLWQNSPQMGTNPTAALTSTYIVYYTKVVIARYRFCSDIIETLPIHHLMFLKYMCEVSKLLTIQNTIKLSLKKQLKKRLKPAFPVLRENWTTFSITINKYFWPPQSSLFVRLKAVSQFISQNLGATDHPVPEIKNYNDRHMAFSHKYTWILWQNFTLWHTVIWRI